VWSVNQQAMALTMISDESPSIEAIAGKRIVGTLNRLRTLLYVCQQSVKCSYEWCILVVNKSNIQSIPRLVTHPYKFNIHTFTYVCAKHTHTHKISQYWVLGALSPEVMWHMQKADHSSSSSAEVRDGESIPAPPLCLHGMVLN
jgi:hypothetical protein